MVVMWCKGCGAFLGLREPLDDWKTVTDGVCPKCARPHAGRPGIATEEKPTAETTDDIPTAKTADDLPADAS